VTELEWPVLPEGAEYDLIASQDIVYHRDYRVLVTGSRDWDQPERVTEALNECMVTAAGCSYSRLVVVHGDNPAGTDATAKAWVFEPYHTMPVIEEPHQANWGKHGKAAGPLRNQEMADSGANYYLAFIGPCAKPDCPNREPHGSHGATDCVIRAVKARIPGRVFT
jgi:hypothetical protein